MEGTITLGDLYKKVDDSVMQFAKDFSALIPVSELTETSRIIILNDIISLKEKAKMAINNVALHKSKQGEEDAESNKENK